MIRLIFIAALLLGLSSLSLTPTGCTTQEEATQPVRELAPTPPPESGEPAAPPETQDAAEQDEEAPPAVAETATALEIPPSDPTDEEDPQFAANAFPPVMPDTERHQRSWLRDDCLRCHETGVEKAPLVRHADMPVILLSAKCRTCHVLIPGAPVPLEAPPSAEEQLFAVNAFPPMIPASGSHTQTWTRDDCLLCHEDGIHGAPIIEHKGLPKILLGAKCRTCHVQVRAVEAAEPVTPR